MLASRPLDRASAFAHVFRDEQAFRRWYDTVAPRVYAYLYGRCGFDVDLAEELTQQTFLQAVRHRDSYDGRAESLTWLIAIARSRFADHFRRLEREGRRHLNLVREIDPREIDADAWRATDDRAAIQAAMRGLTPAQRLALVLRYVDGLPVREVAQALGRSEKAAETLITRARLAFRTQYEDRDRG
jgi:RNA polymerase sigma-70 factor (ECF subfamily)